ncbi:MAG: hypothetical protein KC620_21965, partial [Myxococcales bacterium]|nr:hypothetical protein [Myxococcales bacterium]
MRHALLGLALAVLVGCDGTTPEPGLDATPTADAGAGCDLALAEIADIRLDRCADGARFALRFTDGTVLTGLGPALQIEGRRVTAEAWPETAWRALADGAEATYAGAGLPMVRLTVALSADAAGPRVQIDAAFSAEDPLVLESAELAAEGADAGLALGGAARALPATPGAYVDALDAGPRTGAQLYFAGDHALHLGALDAAGALRFSASRDAEP